MFYAKIEGSDELLDVSSSISWFTPWNPSKLWEGDIYTVIALVSNDRHSSRADDSQTGGLIH